MADPIQQHYVTRAYLEGFLNDGEERLYVFGRKGKTFRALPKNVAKIHHYYSAFRRDGTVDFSLEHHQANEIEGPGMVAVRKLANGNINLSPQQREALAKIIALHTVRVPYERDFMDNHHVQILKSYLQRMNELSISTGAPVDSIEVAVSNSSLRPPPRGAWLRLYRGDVEALIREVECDPSAHSREVFLSVAKKIAQVYSGMSWQVNFAPSNSFFVTCDCPVTKTFKQSRNESGEGIRRLDCEVFFPVSKSTLLTMRHNVDLVGRVRKHNRHMRGELRLPTRTLERADLSVAEVQRFNEMIVDSASDWVFGGSVSDWIGDRLRARARPPKRARIVQADTMTYKTPTATHEFTKQEMVVVGESRRTGPTARD